MANGGGESGAAAGGTPKGQQKMHTITNSGTGESREISQAEWREQGKELRAQGWTRPEGEADTDEATGAEGATGQ